MHYAVHSALSIHQCFYSYHKDEDSLGMSILKGEIQIFWGFSGTNFPGGAIIITIIMILQWTVMHGTDCIFWRHFNCIVLMLQLHRINASIASY